MSIGGLVPLPSDALVTPVTFRVKKRHLRGLLSEFDALESGTRELSGEWIVGRRTWQRLQAEWKAAHPGSTKRKERVTLYIHGGPSLFPLSPLRQPISFRRRILSLERRCTASDFDTSGQAYRFASVRCVSFLHRVITS